jgi:hypothetical protein
LENISIFLVNVADVADAADDVADDEVGIVVVAEDDADVADVVSSISGEICSCSKSDGGGCPFWDCDANEQSTLP